MSKASEWCDAISKRMDPAADAPVFLNYDFALHRLTLVATVRWHSGLYLSESVLDASRAIALARWILDTFGDSPGTSSAASGASAP